MEIMLKCLSSISADKFWWNFSSNICFQNILIKYLLVNLFVGWKNDDVVQPCIYQYLTHLYFCFSLPIPFVQKNYFFGLEGSHFYNIFFFTKYRFSDGFHKFRIGKLGSRVKLDTYAWDAKLLPEVSRLT